MTSETRPLQLVSAPALRSLRKRSFESGYSVVGLALALPGVYMTLFGSLLSTPLMILGGFTVVVSVLLILWPPAPKPRLPKARLRR